VNSVIPWQFNSLSVLLFGAEGFVSYSARNEISFPLQVTSDLFLQWQDECAK
jgi:hypothetical protein